MQHKDKGFYICRNNKKCPTVEQVFHWFIWRPSVAQSSETCAEDNWYEKSKQQEQLKMKRRKNKKFTSLSRVSIARIIYLRLKKVFFQEWASKSFFNPHVSCRPAWVIANQHILKSGLIKNYFVVQLQKLMRILGIVV